MAVKASASVTIFYIEDDPFIIGTQTAATGSWTGVAPFSSLTDGQKITYWLPYAGSGNATLNLTLSTGSATGAKNCYYGGTTRITTHYPAGSAVRLIYQSAAKVGSSTYEGWWADANYDSGNTYDRVRYAGAVKASSAIVAGNIIAGTSGGYFHLKTGSAFDITYPILYANSAISSGSTGTNNYTVIPFTVTTTQSITLTAYASVYIKGSLSGTAFTPVSTAPLTQDIPTEDDGYYYMLLGTAYSTAAMYLLADHPIFRYYNGAFKSTAQIAVEAQESVDELGTDVSDSIIALREEVGSDLNQTEELIKSTIYENVYLKDEVDTLISATSTEIEQTKDSWQVTFNQFTQDLNDLAAGNDASFDEIRKYIRFEDGNIIIGNSESPLILRIQNDRIQFLQNGYEVAYITDRKMYNTSCEIIDRLIIGDSAWVAESNSDGDTVISLIEI